MIYSSRLADFVSALKSLLDLWRSQKKKQPKIFLKTLFHLISCIIIISWLYQVKDYKDVSNTDLCRQPWSTRGQTIQAVSFMCKIQISNLSCEAVQLRSQDDCYSLLNSFASKIRLGLLLSLFCVACKGVPYMRKWG